MMQNRRGGFGPAEGVSRVYPSTNRASGQNKGHARRASALGLRWFRNPAATRNGDSARQVAGKGRRRKERTRNIAGARSSADFPFRSAWSLQTGLGLSAAPVRALFKSPAAARGRPNSLCAGCAAPAYEQAFLVHRRGRTITLLAQKSGANVRCHLKLGRSRRRIANGGYGA